MFQRIREYLFPGWRSPLGCASLRAPLAVGLFVLAPVGLEGCKGACESLADQICSCRPTRLEQDACIQEIALNKSLDVSDAQNATCDKLLDGCTCEALERHDFAACGLARPEKTP